MFTSQRKAWSSLTITPRTEGPRDGTPNPRIAGKGKAVTLVDVSPPSRRLLSENKATMAVAGGLETGDVEGWRRFREAGLLDEAAMERKDREALLERVAKVEKESGTPRAEEKAQGLLSYFRNQRHGSGGRG